MRVYQLLLCSTIILLLGVLTLIGAKVGGFWFDMECFKIWSAHIHTDGLSCTYTHWNNYMPVYQYIMKLYGVMMGTEARILEYVRLLKGFTLAFEFLGLWFVWKWIDKRTDFLLLLCVNMLNIAYSYNSVIWGQVDGIHTMMVFAAIYYGCERKIMLSAVWYLLAMNMKLQAIVFLPPLALIYLYHVLDTKKWQLIPYVVLMVSIGQALILWPFLRIENGIALFWKQVTSATSIYPQVSLKAMNFWNLVVSGDTEQIPDKEIFISGLSYRMVGLLLFFASSFAALWPLLNMVWNKLAGKAITMLAKEKIWLVCALIAILFYFFNTQMHERYCHPAWIFLTAYAFYSGRFLPYILFSAAYLLNMERVMRFLWLPNYDRFFFFSPQFVAVLYLFCIIYLFFRLYSKKAMRPIYIQPTPVGQAV